MRLAILEVLSNPIPYHEVGILTADVIPGVGNLTQQFIKSPVFSHTPGVGGGYESDKL